MENENCSPDCGEPKCGDCKPSFLKKYCKKIMAGVVMVALTVLVGVHSAQINQFLRGMILFGVGIGVITVSSFRNCAYKFLIELSNL